MTTYFVLKYLHVIGAAVLLGTGGGIAFFMLVAHLDGKPAVVAGVARIVVIADFIFTATAVVAQPITGTAAGPDRWAIRSHDGWIALVDRCSTSLTGAVLAAGRLDADAACATSPQRPCGTQRAAARCVLPAYSCGGVR